MIPSSNLAFWNLTSTLFLVCVSMEADRGDAWRAKQCKTLMACASSFMIYGLGKKSLLFLQK